MTDRESFAEVLDEYLRALEAGNPPDREELLAGHPDLAEELQAALLGIDFVHGAAPRLAPEEQADALPGGLLGDYRLLRELGRGGMAVVYEAEQISLGRHVALKVLPFAAVLDPKQLQRFKNEAMAAGHLRHPNIVPVYGVGCERGVHYYAMQYVEGQSLATAIGDMKRGRRSTGDGPKTPISSHGSNREPAYIRMAATLGVQAAEALDHAHQLGIVHRDVKPGNLLADLAGTLWVTDFGLASSMKDVSLTITGELLGTIRYMSPEQALAKRVPVDHRTDVYSLGATLYELFTLEPAFPGDDPHRVIQDIALKEPVLPRRLNPALPRDLETVLLKAMSKDASGRYATAQEMADDLTRFLENRPIEAKRAGLIRRASKWSRRHRALVGATAMLLLLSTAGLATGTALLWSEQARTKAIFENALAACDRAIEIDPRSAGACYNRGILLWLKGDPEGAIASYREAIRLDPDFAEAHFQLGQALMRRGRFQEAVPCFRRGHELGSRRVGWAYRSAEWIEDAERKAKLAGQDSRLDQMLYWNARPRDAIERIELALALYDKASHGESARMFAEAFAEDAALAEDLAKSLRYNAACSAALAAAPGGADAAEWRGWALEWLRADLAACEKAAVGLAASLEHWKQDPDFASVRDRLDDLPEPERAAWCGLWAAVDLALAAARPAAK